MRAIVFYRHGGSEVLEYREDIPEPQPGPGEVLVAVRYAALNRLDDFVRTGWRGLDLSLSAHPRRRFQRGDRVRGRGGIRVDRRPAGGR